jgi:hypothetical protein
MMNNSTMMWNACMGEGEGVKRQDISFEGEGIFFFV